MQNAIDQKVDGIALTAAKPDAMKDVIAKATAAGIPVVGFNSGLDDWKDLGMLEYFGQDENIAGQAFGERLNQAGAKHALCVIQEQGQVALEAAVRRSQEGLRRHHGHPVRQRHRHALREVDDHRQAPAGLLRSTGWSPSAPRSR